MNYTAILEEIYHEVKPLVGVGQIAEYIPELAHISPDKFGMAVQTVDGALFQVGDAADKFSIQSISKVFTLTMAMQFEADTMWSRIGRDARTV